MSDEQPHNNDEVTSPLGAREIRIPLGSLDLSQGSPERHILLEYALTQISQNNDPDMWAQIQIALGNALMQRRTGDREAQLTRAVACYDAALTVYTRDESLIAWGRAQLNKGVALWYLARLRIGEAKKQILTDVLACYDSLLFEEYRQVARSNWVMAQFNKGIALRDLATMFSGSGQIELLREAIACCHTALSTAMRKCVPSLTKRASCSILGSGGAADAWTQAADAHRLNRSRTSDPARVDWSGRAPVHTGRWCAPRLC